MIEPSWVENRFCTFGVFRLEFLEICKFIFMPEYFSTVFLGFGFRMALSH